MKLFESIVTDLRAQETALVEKLATVEGDYKGVKEELKTVRRALRSLEKPPADGKPPLTQDAVTAAVLGILQERGACHKEVLVEAVQQRVTAEGTSRAGLKAKLKVALRDARLVGEENGDYRLTEGGREQSDQKGKKEADGEQA